MKLTLLGIFLALAPAFGQGFPPGNPIFPRPLSPRNANYQIAVTLDPATKRLDGRQTLVWRNISNDAITELQFHLYLNAFRNNQSTFMKESGGQLRGVSIDESDREAFGWIDVRSLRVRGGADLTRQMQFIQPDDGNPDDRTVVRVPLGRPLWPGESITLDFTFRAKLPKIFARTGFSRDYYLVGQWFPKIGVYEPAGTRYATRGQWNCHQFHANSEFYADYGVYDVAIPTPKDYWVGATGLMQRETTGPNGTKTLYWRAEDVVDFAWTASPRFQVFEDQWRHVRLKALMQPEHADQARRHLDAAKAALAYFDKHLGRYPFPNLTIVDPPFHGLGSGGMEYPTFITTGTSAFLPSGLRFPEIVTVHEFGHQYFMQLLATNEFEEAWMDEGFNQYYEGRIMDETYGPKSSSIDFFGYRMGNFQDTRSQYVHQDNPAIGASFGNVWDLPEGRYGVLTYSKPAVWMKTLEGLVGRPVMDEIMRTYFQRWQFRHPGGKDFIAIVNEIVPKRLGTRYGPDMNWFFEQVLYGSRVCDYELHRLSNRRAGNQYRTTVTVYRRGDAQLPVEVQVRFGNGKDQWLRWDGRDYARTFTLTQDSPAVWAKVDPQHSLFMDTHFANNSYATQPSAAPSAKYAAKLLFWVQNWMLWLASLV